MRPLTIDEVRFLIARENGPCVSLYLSTRRGGGTDDRQRYAGLVRRAREVLQQDHPPAKVAALLAPLDALAKEDELWRHALDGLCVFRSSDVALYYRLPLAFEELVVVSDSFHVRPLMRFLQSNERYFLLNLSQGRVSLFKGSAMGLGPIDLRTLPRSMAQALDVLPGERSLQYHTGGQRGGAPIYYASGREDSVREEELLQFLRSVDRALWDVLRDETAPLVLATTPRMASVFESVSRYSHLLHEHVPGSHANAKLEELHARAWPLVQAHAAERQANTARHYGNLISSGRALDDVASIARCAVQGRVRDLLVERGMHVWGRLDRATGAVDVRSERPAEAVDDLLDDIAEAVLLRGGEVVTLERAQMPTRSPVAATLRW